MEDNKIFWKLSTNGEIVVPGKYENFKEYLAKLKKVERAIDNGVKFVDQTIDGGKTFRKVNIQPVQKIQNDRQLTIDFGKEKPEFKSQIKKAYKSVTDKKVKPRNNKKKLTTDE